MNTWKNLKEVIVILLSCQTINEYPLKNELDYLLLGMWKCDTSDRDFTQIMIVLSKNSFNLFILNFIARNLICSEYSRLRYYPWFLSLNEINNNLFRSRRLTKEKRCLPIAIERLSLFPSGKMFRYPKCSATNLATVDDL